VHLRSSAFESGDEIPLRYTCDGSELSPPLSWDELPPGTRSLALIVEDPDAPDPNAPRRIFTHWVLYNLPPEVDRLDEAIADAGVLPEGTKLGINDSQEPAYGGPCPPVGRHRYFFRLYALDTILPDLGFPDRSTLLKAMEGHILGSADLIGTYTRH
jgi:Raf kinase inhibitor-like YbhB/YbcL family protein